MRDFVYFEEHGYVFWCDAHETASGEWEVFVYFQRKSDLTKDLVPGMRHRIKATFKTRNQALAAGADFGFDRARKDETAL